MRILIVDDHVVFRHGVISILTSAKAQPELEVVGEAADGGEAMERVRELAPDLVLMDIHMPRVNGIEATRQIKAVFPQTKVIMLTVSDDDQDLFAAIKSGADGYLLKNLSSRELLGAIKAIEQGEAAISGSLAARILKEMTRAPEGGTGRPRSGKEILSDRERQVLQMASEGKTNKEIAVALGIAENTVKNHMRNVLEKLHLQNRTQAAAFALKEGLVDQDPTGHPR